MTKVQFPGLLGLTLILNFFFVNQDLKQMPQMAALRKLNDFSKRARLVMMHAIILNEVLARCPIFSFSKSFKSF